MTAEVMGNEVDAIHDIGVAGIHRLMQNRERLMEARVVIVCGGNGRRAAERGGRIGRGAGDRGARPAWVMARAFTAWRRCWGC